MVHAEEILVRNLKDLRSSRGLTQDELAESLDIGFRTIQSYEHGTRFPKPEFLNKIAEFYEVEVAELFIDRQASTKTPPSLPQFLSGLATHADAAELLAQLPKDSNVVKNFKAMAMAELLKAKAEKKA